MHEKIREYECHLCHKNFSSLNTVHTHIRTMHSNIEYNCVYCVRTYTSKLSLRYHKKKPKLPDDPEVDQKLHRS
ncbi:PR domain zinc finger protein 14-like isoform X2 [Culex pipiens pallens]|uniref:PR domain zinc finger protein 14-like isoform X2 n=1 Tax=Culex pipiens pallens TaxID=42434 RepID=UPI001954928D|nr:PR domain zinc finger protein 14-like isoform X2 [Culex pipiens pallens]